MKWYNNFSDVEEVLKCNRKYLPALAVKGKNISNRNFEEWYSEEIANKTCNKDLIAKHLMGFIQQNYFCCFTHSSATDIF